MTNTDNKFSRPFKTASHFSCWVCEDTQVVWEDKDTGKYANPTSKNITACWCPRCVR